MEMDEETITISADDVESSYFDGVYNFYDSVTGFIQNNGWYLLVLVIFLAYLVNKLWPRYQRWLDRRAEDAYEAEIKKNPDLIKQKQEELQKARIKFQEEYEKKAQIALEKQKEKEKKLLEEREASLDAGHTLKRSEKSKHKPDYNPLMGYGSGSNYRPPRRSPCSGGGCG